MEPYQCGISIFSLNYITPNLTVTNQGTYIIPEGTTKKITKILCSYKRTKE